MPDSEVPKGWNPKGLTLECPSWMCGEEYNATETQNYDERRMDSSNKASKMGQGELDRAVSDCQVGFGVVSRADDQASMNPVCSSSVTNDSGSRKRIGDVLLEAGREEDHL